MHAAAGRCRIWGMLVPRSAEGRVASGCAMVSRASLCRPRRDADGGASRARLLPGGRLVQRRHGAGADALAHRRGVAEGAWRRDLRQIKALGFNTVRTWVEWSAGEPREGEYHLEHLDLLLRLAEDVGLRVHRAGVRRLGARVGGPQVSRRRTSSSQGGTPSARRRPRATASITPACAPAVHGFFQEVARRASAQPRVPRLRPLERAGGDELGAAHLLARTPSSATARTASRASARGCSEARVASSAQPRVVPHVLGLGRGGAARASGRS